MALSIKHSCEIEDLISEIQVHSEKDYDTVESALMTVGLYPESNKTFAMKNSLVGNGQDHSIVNDCPDELQWLEDAMQAIFDEVDITSVYITIAI